MTATPPAPVYLDHPPMGLVARLYYTFPLTDGTGRWAAYPRQEESRMIETTTGETDLGQLYDWLVQELCRETGDTPAAVGERVNRAWLRIAAAILAEGAGA